MALIIYKGFTKQLPCTYTAGGAAVNLTGKTVACKLKLGGGVLLEIVQGTATALGSTLTITNATLGQFQLTLTDEETLALAKTTTGKISFEYRESGAIYPIAFGTVEVV